MGRVMTTDTATGDHRAGLGARVTRMDLRHWLSHA
ncbi:hypothetical protein STVIR_2199 [Streptomyces viridochromogenes Tue57]|uniref:Uncharacterized protein n=1 Tax=Streptomyces viridochromogenes Tue57 TaxID=1160705 RepID=L8PLF6_STRVR|nr:hypothetical protein STVIR_2199 [Streptomyces viridochromogenes Tue57]